MSQKILAILFLFASITLFTDAQPNNGGAVNSAQIGPSMDTLLMCIIQKMVERMIPESSPNGGNCMDNNELAEDSSVPNLFGQFLQRQPNNLNADGISEWLNATNVMNKMQTAVVECVGRQFGDLSECCRNRGVPNECLALCGSNNNTSNASIDFRLCGNYSDSILGCRFGKELNLDERNMNAQQQKDPQCKAIAAECQGIPGICAALFFDPPVGAACGIATAAGCVSANLLRNCWD